MYVHERVCECVSVCVCERQRKVLIPLSGSLTEEPFS